MIFLFTRGGPSPVDSFDYKPELSKRHNEDLGGGRKYFQYPCKFNQHGECVLPVSELFPNIAQHADDLCVVNSMHTDVSNHPQATLQVNTGSFQFIRPSAHPSGSGSITDSAPRTRTCQGLSLLLRIFPPVVRAIMAVPFFPLLVAERASTMVAMAMEKVSAR